MKHNVKILMAEFVTHDVKRFIVAKPEGYKFIPGQANKLSINEGKWKHETRPFTFTNLNEDLVLEFTIKRYEEHKGVTNQLHKLKAGDELILRDVFGTINYKGKGVFIAGGAGITPFIAILRQLNKEKRLRENTVIFSNKTSEDIILEQELKFMFKGTKNLILTLTREENKNYENKRINADFLKEKIYDFNQNFYVCGPRKFVQDIIKILKKFGVRKEFIIFEDSFL